MRFVEFIEFFGFVVLSNFFVDVLNAMNPTDITTE